MSTLLKFLGLQVKTTVGLSPNPWCNNISQKCECNDTKMTKN